MAFPSFFDGMLLRTLREKQPQQHCVCKLGGMLYGLIINAKLSLQSASQNSRENIQRQSWSQIREI
ncbi:hypothetical protein CJ232_10030 [Hoylesella timonensis]|uniref:Uncharacterized protein n=1 Tax=Hoylesella timonensis TaxID=386414 RepID=A0A2N6Q3U4_9BACT|nr:hypothetical protein CJ232_10030 [Hoylesella timonensis]